MPNEGHKEPGTGDPMNKKQYKGKELRYAQITWISPTQFRPTTEYDHHPHNSKEMKQTEDQYQWYAADLYITAAQKEQIQRNIGKDIHNEDCSQVVGDCPLPVSNQWSLMSVGGEKVQKNICEKEETDEEKDYSAEFEDKVLEGNLEWDQGATHKNQDQNRQIPGNPEAWAMLYRFHG